MTQKPLPIPSENEAPAPETAPESLELYLTAEEAFPALEREFLRARTEISAGFRVFDLDTSLYSNEAKAVGKTWFDLVTHTLARGVRIRMVLSDFDPILAYDLHRMTWRSMRQFIAAAEAADAQDRLTLIPALHPAEGGIVPRIVFGPLVWRKLKSRADQINRLPRLERVEAVREAPGLARFLSRTGDRYAPRIALPRLHSTSHHQKVAVFDERRAYIGGLDLNERRYDTKRHDRPAEATWHDVQCLVTGDPARGAAKHLSRFVAVTDGREKSEPIPGLPVTLSRRRARNLIHVSPAPVENGIEDQYARLIPTAERLIYLETQFFRHIPLARRLADAARARPDLRMMLMIPAAPEDVAFEGNGGLDAKFGEYLQTRCLRIVRKAFGPRLFVGAPARNIPAPPREDRPRSTYKGAPLIYIHAKIGVFDETAAIISSANLNGRSLRWDTEAGVVLTEPGQVKRLRLRAFRHWLPEEPPAEALKIETATAAWKELAGRNLSLPPQQRAGFILPYDPRPARAMGEPVSVVPDEMV